MLNGNESDELEKGLDGSLLCYTQVIVQLLAAYSTAQCRDDLAAAVYYYFKCER